MAALRLRPKLGGHTLEPLRVLHLLNAAADTEATSALQRGFIPADWSADWATVLQQIASVKSTDECKPFEVAASADSPPMIVRILLAEQSADVTGEVLDRALARFEQFAKQLRERISPSEHEAVTVVSIAQQIVAPFIANDPAEVSCSLAESLVASRFVCGQLSLLIAALVEPFGIQTQAMEFLPDGRAVGHAALRVDDARGEFWWETTIPPDRFGDTSRNRFPSAEALIAARYPDLNQPAPDGQLRELDVTLLPPVEYAAQAARRAETFIRPFLP